MARGILLVETFPASPEDAAAYHEWYEGIHLKEMTALDGVVSARRFAALGGDGPFIAIYELDTDDIAAVQSRIREAAEAGRMSAPVGVATDPPARVVLCRETASHTP